VAPTSRLHAAYEPSSCAQNQRIWASEAIDQLPGHPPGIGDPGPRPKHELGGLLVAAGRLGQPADHALISLLALNGLRVSEATGANIEALGVERGHRTLTITRNGGKVATIPLAPRTAPGDRPGRRGAQSHTVAKRCENIRDRYSRLGVPGLGGPRALEELAMLLIFTGELTAEDLRRLPSQPTA
jgi:integrase